MGLPRLEINLKKIGANTQAICDLYNGGGISVTGVTKAVLGAPQVAKVMVENGITTIGDSRIQNIRTMKDAGIAATYLLIRTPMLSEIEEVVEYADISLNTELSVIESLAAHAFDRGKCHKIILMIELGDMREGIPPSEIETAVKACIALEGVELIGIGTNLACFSGVQPSDENMGKLSGIAGELIERYGTTFDVISGGNSASYEWFSSTNDHGRINTFRIGESIFLGKETLHRRNIPGLYTDAITLVAEVIEMKTKIPVVVGETAQNAFGQIVKHEDEGTLRRAILGIGRQDTEFEGLIPRIDIDLLGATSDHLVINAKNTSIEVGSEISFDISYAALLRSMTCPHVTKEFS
jgi:ornithine racemase